MDEQALADAGRARRLAAVAYALIGDAPTAEVAAVEALSGTRTSLDATGDELRALVRICVTEMRRARLRARLRRAREGVKEGHSESPDVMRAVRNLPPRERAAVVLARMEGLDHDGIATAMDCSEATARALLAGAAERLGTALGTDVAGLREMLSWELRRVSTELESQRALDLGTAARMISLERRRRTITLVGAGAALIAGAGLIYVWLT